MPQIFLYVFFRAQRILDLPRNDMMLLKQLVSSTEVDLWNWYKIYENGGARIEKELLRLEFTKYTTQ